MMILGDPGSGKTTLARWIALKLAIAMLNKRPTVIVPIYQVDPEVNKSDNTVLDIGPARLPVLVRVSEFAEAYQEARHSHDTLTLVDFLGLQSWLGQYPTLPRKGLNALIKHYLRVGRAVIILDGMDEVTSANQRDDVVRAIEVFINDWINVRGTPMSMQEKSMLWNSTIQGEPVKYGGNQIIITSRIAGYQAAPITGQVTHVTIQPMQRIAVEHFCDSWTLAVRQLLYPSEDLEITHKEAAIESAGLKAAIFDPYRPRVRELASNPLLVTILALVYRNNRGRLPQQRVELYHTAMQILIEAWRTTELTTVELIYILSPLAAHIHQHYPTGYIEESEMREVISDELAGYRHLDVFNLPHSFTLDLDKFLRRVREDVGLLTERSEQLYGFLHLTFQEYLAALYLVRDKQQAADKIIDKLNDPRWREPILMALGHISINKDWGPRARQTILTSLLEADDPLGDLIPRSALLITSAIPEMARVPEKVINQIIQSLLSTYANREGTGGFDSLRKGISQALENLYSSDHRPILENHLIKVLRHIHDGSRDLAMAAAEIITQNKWYSDNIIKTLIDAYPYDDHKWDYPITKALNDIVTPDPEKLGDPPKPPQSSKSSPDRSVELDQLENELTEIKDGLLAQKIESQIAEIEAEFAKRWQAYKLNVFDTEIKPRQEKIEKIRSGLLQHELHSEIIKLQQQISDLIDKESFIDESAIVKKVSNSHPLSLIQSKTKSRLQARLIYIEKEFEEIANNRAVERLQKEIVQFEIQLQQDER